MRSDGLIIAPGLGLCWPCCCARGWHVSQGRNRNTTLTKHVEDKTTVEETMNRTPHIQAWLSFSELESLYIQSASLTLIIYKETWLNVDLSTAVPSWDFFCDWPFTCIGIFCIWSDQKEICQMTYWLLTFLVEKDLLYYSHLSVVFVLEQYSWWLKLLRFSTLWYYNNLFYIMHSIMSCYWLKCLRCNNIHLKQTVYLPTVC